MNHNRRAILYVRVSTDEQVNGYSLTHQEERLRTYCELQGISIVTIYHEDHSAKTFDRPQFQKLLATLKKNRNLADLLLFLKWDRFSRNAGDAYGMISVLGKLGIEPQAIEQPLDLAVPENKMMLAFYLAAPEVENDRRALNTLTGMRRARKDGRWLGRAPKGYKNKRDVQNKPILAPDEKYAPLVRWAFEQLAVGVLDIETVRRQVNEKGLPVSRSQFWNLVHNMVYCGRVEIAAYKDERAHYVKGIHEPLVSEALFDDVQDILSGRKRVTKVRSSKDENLPLRSFLICKTCGKPITGSATKGNGGRYYYYHCQTAAACKERYRADNAHEVFVEMLRGITAKKEILELYGRMMAELFRKNGADKTKLTREVQAQIEKLKQRLSNAQALMLDAELSATEYRDIRNALTPEMEALERRRISILTSEDDYAQYVERGIPLLQNIDKHWLAADLAGKQHIVGSMFPQKLVFEKKGYRTIGENPVLALIAAVGAGSSASKKKKVSISADLSAMVVAPGFEPRQTEPKSVVLPLHHATIRLVATAAFAPASLSGLQI